MTFYFEEFEGRKPPKPLPHSIRVELIWQFLATMNLTLGAWYIWWRWTHSLNLDALWFSVPLVIAETLAYCGLILFTINLWKVQDYPRRPPPARAADVGADEDRPLSVDIFIATYNEDEELVRLSIRDAKAVTYPHPIQVHIHVLDDGRRSLMRSVAAEEGVGYITRDSNIGYKAGNLRNGMEHTSGDFIVICDADTRLFPSMLENTLGYFRDPDVAFVQTPQWFWDLPAGRTLTQVLERRLGRVGRVLGSGVERVFGKVMFGEDPFANDPQLFYDVIMRRRNWANAVFCCGAASVHRREAVMMVALRSYASAITAATKKPWLALPSPKRPQPDAQTKLWLAAQELELTPYKFHVSEDIYTSLALHQDRERRWKSVYHPEVESRMLSPQDLLACTIQRFKYAGGSLDIFFHDNPIGARACRLRNR